eukprot:scaffold102932_cov39-Phaeocystis_antarctica.AAC.1
MARGSGAVGVQGWCREQVAVCIATCVDAILRHAEAVPAAWSQQKQQPNQKAAQHTQRGSQIPPRHRVVVAAAVGRRDGDRVGDLAPRLSLAALVVARVPARSLEQLGPAQCDLGKVARARVHAQIVGCASLLRDELEHVIAGAVSHRGKLGFRLELGGQRAEVD